MIGSDKYAKKFKSTNLYSNNNSGQAGDDEAFGLRRKLQTEANANRRSKRERLIYRILACTTSGRTC